MRIRRDGLSVQEVDGSIVVLDLESSRYLTVSQAGTALWRLLERGSDRAAMEAALVAAYGLQPEEAARDVDAFVTQLSEAALLERSP